MKPVALDQPFRLSPDFWAAYGLLAVPTLWLAQPWQWDVPIYSILAALAFLPFAAAIVCYCPLLFIDAIVRGGQEEKRLGRMFLTAVAGAAFFLGVAWVSFGFQQLPSTLGGLAAFFTIARFHFSSR